MIIYPFGSVFVAAQTIESTNPNLDRRFQSEIDVTTEGYDETISTDTSPTMLGALGSVVLDDAKYLLTSPLRMDATDALVLGGVAAGIGGLMAADGDIRDVFQRNRGATRDDIADGLASAGSSHAFFAGHLGLIAGGFWFRESEAGDKLFRTALISFEAQVFTEATAGFVKVAAGRRRPNKERGSHSYTPLQDLSFDRSFPSSHAARAFAAAAVFADHYPQPVPFLAYSAASLIGLSRVLLDEHYASDVFAGAALGFVIGKTLSWRHRDREQQWSVFPMLPDRGDGVGLTFYYTF